MTASWRPRWGAITRCPGPLVGLLETRHHTRGVAGPAGCFSRTLSASLPLCRKCSYSSLGCPFICWHKNAPVYHPRFEPLLDRAGEVRAGVDLVQERCLIYLVEAAGDICVQHISGLFADDIEYLFDGVLA